MNKKQPNQQSKPVYTQPQLIQLGDINAIQGYSGNYYDGSTYTDQY